jgi:proline dehydrogenase
VAGESLDEAVEAAQRLNRMGLLVALDHLGENTRSEAGASDAAAVAVSTLDRMGRDGLRAYLSIKLSQLGLEVGEHVAIGNAGTVLEQAKTLSRFVRLDMEGSDYTARTLEVFERLRRHFDNVGAVIQAYLYRSASDAERLSRQGASIRLCKGAYNEPSHIAFRRKRDTDRNFVRIMEYLLLHGNAPAIATHDSSIIEHACEFAKRNHLAADRFEFQMLYGVRRDLQEVLVHRGYNVRVYVPFGSQWYPYMTRRLAERPANLLSVGGSLARERLRV